MSIIIQNMGGPSDGVCDYELRINKQVIAKFQHNRCFGLEECLIAAAAAVRMERMRDAMRILEDTFLKKTDD